MLFSFSHFGQLVTSLLLVTVANKPAAPALTIQCNVVYKPSLALSYRPAQQTKVTLNSQNSEKTIQLGDFKFQAMYREEQERSLQLIVTPNGNTLPIASQVYQLERQQQPRNQFSGGHDFTGLNYVMNPKTTSDLQYSCSSSSR